TACRVFPSEHAKRGQSGPRAVAERSSHAVMVECVWDTLRVSQHLSSAVGQTTALAGCTVIATLMRQGRGTTWGPLKVDGRSADDVITWTYSSTQVHKERSNSNCYKWRARSRRARMVHRVADELVERLAEAGVKRIYGLVGDSLNPVTDAIRRNGKLQWIHVR